MRLANLNNLEQDFWPQNPFLHTVEPFKSFKKKRGSDKIMKALYLINDPRSPHYTETYEVRVKDVSSSVLDDEEYDWSKHSDLVEAYKDKCRTPTQKLYDTLLSEIEDINTSIDIYTFEDEDEMRARIELTKFRDQQIIKLAELESKLKEELAEIELYGDYYPSLIEKEFLDSQR